VTPNAASTGASAIVLDGSYSWFRLAVSIMVSALGSIGIWAFILVVPAVQSEFGIDRSDASIPYTATMIGFAIGNMIIGRVVDRLGIVPPLIFAAVTLGAGFGLATMTSNIWVFSILHLLVGLSASVSFGPLIADVSHWFEKRRGIAVAATASGNYLSGSIWPLFLKGMIETEGWRSAYLTIAVIGSIGIILLSFFLRRPAPHMNNENYVASAPKFNIKLSPRALQILLTIAGLGCCVAMSMPQVHIVAYCTDLGFGMAVGAEMLSLMLVGGIISRLISGFLADYIGGVKTLIIGSFLQCLALFLYIPFDGLVSLYIVSAIFGLSQGGIVPSYAIIVREYLPAKEAGERVGVVIMATVFGMALGGWLSGLIYDLTQSYQAAFINGIIWNIMNLAIAFMVIMRTVKQQPQPA
jgi:MFS family permease